MKTATLKQADMDVASAFAPTTMIAGAVSAFGAAQMETVPYKHWFFKNILSADVCHAIIGLPLAPIAVDETYGKRDSHNEIRRFFSPALQAQYPVIKAVADTFQSAPVVRAIEKLCNVNLKGSLLRIEYCQDRGSFWLEPHMDIKEKHITLQLYLNTGEGADALGTDIYDHDKKYFSSAPSSLGEAMLFVPKEPQSWHGFEKRAIPDVRRSLLINYVTDDWRSVHELSFPDQKVS